MATAKGMTPNQIIGLLETLDRRVKSGDVIEPQFQEFLKSLGGTHYETTALDIYRGTEANINEQLNNLKKNADSGTGYEQLSKSQKELLSNYGSRVEGLEKSFKDNQTS